MTAFFSVQCEMDAAEWRHFIFLAWSITALGSYRLVFVAASV